MMRVSMIENVRPTRKNKGAFLECCPAKAFIDTPLSKSPARRIDPTNACDNRRSGRKSLFASSFGRRKQPAALVYIMKEHGNDYFLRLDANDTVRKVASRVSDATWPFYDADSPATKGLAAVTP